MNSSGISQSQVIAAAGLIGLGLFSADAWAADLPAKSATPVEYVRVCSTYGAGFFTIPGTETCLRISGRVRAELRYLEPGSREDDSIGFRARGRVNLDARTPTSYGLLRTFIRYEITRNTGNYGDDTVNVDRAFVEFAGFTAGRVQSFFDFYTNDYNFGSIFVSDFSTQALAYTAKFGSLSATLAIEDGIERQFFNGPNGTGYPGQGFEVAGERMPDVVGQLLWEQSWGKMQLSAALHQIRSDNLVPPLDPVAFPDTEYGFAVQGGLQFKLPSIAAGDELWLQAGYAEGAMSYLGMGNTSIKDLNLSQTDAYVDEFGNVERSRAWAATALFVHYWTPEIRQAVFASYGVIDYPSNSAVTAANGGSAGFIDSTDLRLGSNIGWIPVSGFYIGVEGIYRHVELQDRSLAESDTIPARLISSADAFEARLRVQRDF